MDEPDVQDTSTDNSSTGSGLNDTQWKMLQDYIEELPDGVELMENNTKAKFKKHNLENGNDYHNVLINELHDLIVDAVKCEPTQAMDMGCSFLLNIIKNRASEFDCKDTLEKLDEDLSFSKNGVTVNATVSPSLIELLQGAVYGKHESQPNKGSITVSVSGHDIDIQDISNEPEGITYVQALLALAVIVKCYPTEWKVFFWDAWLAVTIQLGLLEKVDNDNPNNEVFPCLWMKQVFIAERLVGSPEKVKCILMGQDPVYKKNQSIGIYLSHLRAATGIAFHNIGDGNKSIQGMTTQYGLDCTGDWPIEYCEQGLLLVNMIRCVPKRGKSMDHNPCYDAWFAYTLQLSKCFDKRVVVMYNKNYTPTANLVKFMLKLIPRDNNVQHPAYVSGEEYRNEFYNLLSKKPILWDILQEFVNALPDNVSFEKYHNDYSDEYVAIISNKHGTTHRAPIHHLIAFAIKYDPNNDKAVSRFLQKIIQDNIWQMLNLNVEEIYNGSFPNNLSIRNKIVVCISEALIELLKKVVVNKKINIQESLDDITITYKKEKKRISSHLCSGNISFGDCTKMLPTRMETVFLLGCLACCDYSVAFVNQN